MAPRSKISQLPQEDKDWLEKELVHRRFSDYQELAELLQQRGYEISHASVHRHGQKLQKTMDRIKLSTEAALLIAQLVPDSQDARSGAVISMLQTGMFEALTKLHEEDEDKMDPEKRIASLAKASQGFSKLVEASLKQKKREDEIKAKLDALEAQAKAQEAQGKDQTSALEMLKLVRETIYGL